MTPDKARALLDNFDRLLPFEAELEMEGAAKDMARMIAGMREEWGIVAVYMGRHEVEEWGFDTRDDAVDKALALDLDEFRIVPRYVTEPEEIK